MAPRGNRLNLADNRAMEEQAQRTNPSDGRGGFTHGLFGGSAVPSSGLSTRRGGAKKKGVDEADLKGMVELVKNHLKEGHKLPEIKKQLKLEHPHATVKNIAAAIKEGKAAKSGAGTACVGAGRRAVARALSGARALEEEAERANPITGGRKGSLSKEAFLKRMAEGKAKKRSGSGHVVGGASVRVDELKVAKLRTPPEPSHAHTMGAQMAKHLMEHHGGRYVKHFGAGFYSEVAAPPPPPQPEKSLGEKIKNEFINPRSKLRGEVLPIAETVSNFTEIPLNMIGLEFGDPLLGTQIKSGATALNRANQAAGAVQNIIETGKNIHGIDDLRNMVNKGQTAFNAANEVRDLVRNPRRLPRGRGRPRKIRALMGCGGGAGDDEDDAADPVSGRGKPRKKAPALMGDTVVLEGGKRRRAKASPSDGRRKRASIVAEVMKKRGLSLIEASKIVKKEGLY